MSETTKTGLWIEPGPVLTYYKWNKDSRVYDPIIVTNEGVIPWLMESCSIDKGVTLEHIVRLILKDLDTLHLMFRDCFIKDYVTEYLESSPDTSNTESEYVKMVIKHFGIDLREHKGEKTLNMESPFVCVYDKDGYEYSVEFIPSKELWDIPIEVSNTVHVTKTHNSKTIENEIVEFDGYESWITLAQIIHAIFYEISFFGTDTMKQSRLQELLDIAKNISDDE